GVATWRMSAARTRSPTRPGPPISGNSSRSGAISRTDAGAFRWTFTTRTCRCRPADRVSKRKGRSLLRPFSNPMPTGPRSPIQARAQPAPAPPFAFVAGEVGFVRGVRHEIGVPVAAGGECLAEALAQPALPRHAAVIRIVTARVGILDVADPRKQ